MRSFSAAWREERIARFVVGLPVHLDGGESRKSTEARAFGQWLAETTGVAVEYFDERFTSVEAEQHLLAAGLTKKQRKGRLDKLAAQIMLTAYLESTAPRSNASGAGAGQGGSSADAIRWHRVNCRGSTTSAAQTVPGDSAKQAFAGNASMAKLIFGCGYLGRRVAERWQAAGENVFAVTRSSEHAREFHERGWQPIVADVVRRATLVDLPRADTIVYAVGFDRTAGRSMHEVYVEGLAAVLDALPPDSGKLIYISSTGVYGSADGGWIGEQTPPHPDREGGQACLAAEAVLRAHPLVERSIILRMAGLYGPGRIPRRREIEAGTPLAVPTEGHLNLIHVDDAAQVVLAAAERAAGGSLYLVSDGHPVPRREYYQELARQLGAPPPHFIPPAADSPAADRARSGQARAQCAAASRAGDRAGLSRLSRGPGGDSGGRGRIVVDRLNLRSTDSPLGGPAPAKARVQRGRRPPESAPC